jgi:acetoin utilization protein AcuB
MGHVAEWMRRPVVTVAPRTGIGEAGRIAAENGVRHLVVLAGERLVGVLCTCDLRDADPCDEVSSRMSRRVHTVGPLTTIEEAAAQMHRSGIGCLPVMSGACLVGMLTGTDLRRAGVSDAKFTGRRCAACGSGRHVRPDPRVGNVAFCCDCRERATSDFADEETGTGD